MSNRRPIDKGTFQVVGAIGTIFTVLVVTIILVAIFYDPDAIAMLMPFVVAGIGWLGWYVAGKIYDRRHKS